MTVVARERWMAVEDRLVGGLTGDDVRRGRAAVRFAWGVAPWGFAFAAAFAALGQPLLCASLILAGAGVGSAPIVLRATSSTSAAVHWMNTMLAQSLLVCAWLLGGVEAACVPWLLVTVVAATFLAGGRAGTVWAALSAAGVLGLLAGHVTGALPEPVVDPLPRWLLAVGAQCGLLAVGLVLVTTVVAVDARARAELEAANRAKSSFLAQMSHELRTPMTAVLGYAELLAEDASDVQREDLERIRASGRHLLDLLDDVLDLSKVSAGRMEFAASPVDLVALARDVLDASAPLLQAHANRAAVEAEEPVVVVADPLRTRQVLLNLVSNAAKFTRDGTVRVGFETAADAGRCAVFVEDTGMGIAPEQLERIFDPFAQASADIQRTHGGTGLGLALARQFVERMGGRLTVVSAVGRGSRFTVWLPAGPGR
jgi:signal transduction histidine kinase